MNEKEMKPSKGCGTGKAKMLVDKFHNEADRKDYDARCASHSEMTKFDMYYGDGIVD